MTETKPNRPPAGIASGLLSGRAWRNVLALCAVTAFAIGCARSEREAVEPIAVTDGTARVGDLADETVAAGDDAAQNDAQTATDSASRGGAGSVAGGLWVVDASGLVVGWLVQRGHPFQAQDGKADILRDGVLVYSASEKVFFGVEMTTGKVLVPRLGIADPQCSKPSVAGYYAAGDQISGMDYAFAYNASWWRVRSGQKTELVQCAGVTKQGATPTCVLHSGTCRGFPVEPLPSPKLPTSFKPPLRFSFGVTP